MSWKYINRQTNIQDGFSRKQIFTNVLQYELENTFLILYFFLVYKYDRTFLIIMPPFSFPNWMTIDSFCELGLIFVLRLEGIFGFDKILKNYYLSLLIELPFDFTDSFDLLFNPFSLEILFKQYLATFFIILFQSNTFFLFWVKDDLFDSLFSITTFLWFIFWWGLHHIYFSLLFYWWSAFGFYAFLWGLLFLFFCWTAKFLLFGII